MDILTAIHVNLLSPAALFFVLGLIAALPKSDLKFPVPLYADRGGPLARGRPVAAPRLENVRVLRSGKF